MSEEAPKQDRLEVKVALEAACTLRFVKKQQQVDNFYVVHSKWNI